MNLYAGENMKTNRYEHLSALLDDEAGEFERRRLLDELCEDAELGKTLNRYMLAGEAMRAQQRTVVVESDSFLAGIQAQLEDEPVYDEVLVQTSASGGSAVLQGGKQASFAPDQPDNREQSRPAAQSRRVNKMRYAIAASVAVAALAGVLVVQNNSSEQNVVATETLAESDAEVVEVAKAPAPPVSNVNAAANTSRRMALTNANFQQQTADTVKQYVALHMQYRTSNGIAPSIQAVSYAK